MSANSSQCGLEPFSVSLPSLAERDSEKLGGHDPVLPLQSSLYGGFGAISCAF